MVPELMVPVGEWGRVDRYQGYDSPPFVLSAPPFPVRMLACAEGVSALGRWTPRVAWGVSHPWPLKGRPEPVLHLLPPLIAQNGFPKGFWGRPDRLLEFLRFFSGGSNPWQRHVLGPPWRVLPCRCGPWCQTVCCICFSPNFRPVSSPHGLGPPEPLSTLLPGPGDGF